MKVDHISISAYLDDFSMITIVVNKPFPIIPSLSLVDDKKVLQPLTIDKQEYYDDLVIYKCRSRIPIDLKNRYWVTFNESRIPLMIGSIVRTAKFDSLYYDDTSLGAIYTPERTTFKVWSPVAYAMRVKYKPRQSDTFLEQKMSRTENGVWQVTLEGDHHLTEYLFVVNVNHEWVETTDPYAKSVTANGVHSVVIHLPETDPEGWNRSEKKINLRSKTDSIIYELHVRDLTIHFDSGVVNKGKYLGLTERGTKTSNGFHTGLDYLKRLGITHVQLLPVADFGSVDETTPDSAYNWGYDPVHFFSPEGSYATDPYDPICRIKELKTLIHTLQQNGLSVILDVVYNHVYKREESPFEKLVPGYYFRFDEGGKPVNGTGVGNDTASERKMMRKFILDALTYWMSEYKVDGFRFDLMGIHDVETMNLAAEKLKSLNPGVFLLGEGWDLNTNLEPENKATLSSAKKLPSYSFFNDAFRDHVKGSIFPDGQSGFINGNQDARIKSHMKQVMRGYAGQHDTFLKAEQSINYSECHDNHTLFDLLSIRHPFEDEFTRRKRQQLALAFTLFAQGVPFIHAGQECFRTKNGVENSYNLPDNINAFDWKRCESFYKEVDYFKQLIRIRKTQPLFHESSSVLSEWKVPEGGLGFELNLPTTDIKEDASFWTNALLLFNQTTKQIYIPIEEKRWTIAIEDEKVCHRALNEEQYRLKPLSFSLLYSV
ncbi:type I pullulanase [Fictibacillus phosphorivorans]|uniref:type I pullulanase n=1 Tax=Fictibacillus phosphorivorans TaxID=1221500 RepID=UPI001293F190|nr:type I pullulanase [Fictibacillus phosphorivorans]MQR95226.1 type I pullulanase [Fictibacillus phosphorivorans]